MAAEKDLNILLKSLTPFHNTGEFVFSSVNDPVHIDINNFIMVFREQEAITVILEKGLADKLNLAYSGIYSWITLQVHSSLEAVGLTAAFSTALSRAGVSCNVVAAFHHDHIFVNKNDTGKAMEILNKLQG